MALEKYRAEAQLHEVARARRRQGSHSRRARADAALLLRAEAPRQPPALRLPPRAQRRAAVVGGAERAVARSRRPSGWRCTVEDHPIDYGEFEGVIPSGYGAGIVMLWDRGTWTPEVDDVDAALKKGDLKFTLDGYKLKGSWVLVRTKGKMGRRRRSVVAADQAPRRLGRRGRHRRVRAAQREEQGRLRRHPRRRTTRTSGTRTGRRRAARPARCSRRSSRGRWRCAADRSGEFGGLDGRGSNAAKTKAARPVTKRRPSQAGRGRRPSASSDATARPNEGDVDRARRTLRRSRRPTNALNLVATRASADAAAAAR